MEGLPQKLQELTKNRYFTYVAVVFFAFVTALVFALLAGQAGAPSADQLRSEIRERQREGSLSGGTRTETDSHTSNENESPLDRIVKIISGDRRTDTRVDTGTGDNPGSDDGSDLPGNDDSRSGTIIPPDNNNEQIVDKIEEEGLPLPEVRVDDYNLQTELPNTPNSVKIYKLKTAYSDAEVEALARKFGFSPFSDENIVIEKGDHLIQIFDLANRLYLAVNNSAGTMTFMAENGVDLGIPSNDNFQIAQTFVEVVGLDHECIRPTSTYTTKSQPQSVNIELRCDWNTLGAPMISKFGIANFPDDQRLSQAVLGVDDTLPDYADITGGLSRPNDFNTMIVQRDTQTGKITFFTSNIPKIESEELVTGSRIIPPPDAFNDLSAGKKQFSFASPTGEGFIDLNAVYANNQAVAGTVNVTDFVLAYTVLPGTQSYLCPEWVTRSYTAPGQPLQTGYDAVVVETVKAVNDSRCSSQVLGVSTLAQNPQVGVTKPPKLDNPSPGVIAPDVRDDTLQYGSFVYEGEVVTESSCPQSAQFTNFLWIDKPNVGMAWIDKNTRSQGGKIGGKGFQLREWHIVYFSEQVIAADSGNNQGFTDEKRREYLRFRGSKGLKCTAGLATDCPINADFEGATTDIRTKILACKYLTTASPSLYLYNDGTMNVEVSVSPHEGVGYADPPLFDQTANSWSIMMMSDGLLNFASGETKHRAYWEYRKYPMLNKLSEYGEPETGYIIRFSELENFVSGTFATEIGLNSQEIKDLVAEMNRETRNVSSEYVKVSVLDREFVDTYMSVDVQPEPENFYRFNLFIQEAAGDESVEPPVLEQIDREGFTAVETGVLVK